MKILMATMGLGIGGAETHILELCKELTNKGYEIVVASNGGVYEKELTDIGIKHVSVPLHTKNPFAVIKSYFALKKLILNGDFDIVHSHARIPSFICNLIWNRYALSGKKFFHFVTTAHLDFSVNILTRQISFWGERTMAVSDDIVDYLKEEYDFYKDRIYTTINGIDCNKFSKDISFKNVIQQHGLNENTKKIVYMSRLDEDRAEVAFKLVNIADKLYENFSNTELVIVGGGDQFGRISQLVQEKNKKIGKNYITLTGPVSNTNEYCSLSTIFIGVSRSLLEAMACSKPVIAAGNQGSIGIFDESKIKPCIDTNFCCRGFDNATEENLFDWIKTLLEKGEDELNKIGEFNRQFILDNYTMSKMANDYIDMYNDAMSLCPYSDKAKKVIISGYYGFDNSGDEALLCSIVDSIRKTNKNVYITVLTSKPQKTKRAFHCNTINRMNFPLIYHCMRKSDIFINGGGNLFQSSTSLRSLIFYSTLALMAKKAGCKTMIYGGGLGPIDEGKAEQITKKVLDATDVITLRESKSTELITKLKVPMDKVTITGDPVLYLSKCEDKWTNRLLEKVHLHGDYFVLSVRKCSSIDYDYEESIARDVEQIKKEFNVECLIIAFQEKDDYKISKSVAEKTNSYFLTKLSSGEMMGIISKAKFVVGMRLHSVIYSSNVGTPYVNIAYDEKTIAYCNTIGNDWYINPKEMGSGAIVEKLKDIYMDYDANVSKMNQKVNETRQKERINVEKVNEWLQN